jgi:hypothetical protein
MSTQEHWILQPEGSAQPIGSSQPPQTQLGLTRACTSMPTRSKNIVQTVEKAIAVIKANKNKMKKPDWKKYYIKRKGLRCVYMFCDILITNSLNL